MAELTRNEIDIMSSSESAVRKTQSTRESNQCQGGPVQIVWSGKPLREGDISEEVNEPGEYQGYVV